MIHMIRYGMYNDIVLSVFSALDQINKLDGVTSDDD